MFNICCRRSPLAFRPFAAVASLALFVVTALGGQTAEEIVSRSIDARGGVTAFAAINTWRASGTLIVGHNQPARWMAIARRPASYRSEYRIGNDRVIKAYDGRTGWQQVTGENPLSPQLLTGNEFRRIVDDGANAIGGPLVDYQQRGTKLELIGSSATRGQQCFQLKLTLRSGTVLLTSVSEASSLEVSEVSMVRPNAETNITKFIDRYKRFSQILFPTLMTRGESGSPEEERLQIRTIEINPPVDSALFAMPTRQ